MSKYKVGSYIRLSRDESYSNSDSIDNQIKLTDFYCEEKNLEVIDLLNIKKLDGESITELTRDIVIKYIEKVTVYENKKIDVILKYEDEIIKN